MKALKTKKGFMETIEVDPAFGKYHWTGHRNCHVRMSPKDALKHNNICPVCKKQLTIGVEQRVEELADREEGFVLKGALPFRRMIPLSDILSTLLKKPVSTKTVWNEYNKLVTGGRSEYDILRKTPEKELVALTNEKIAQIILKNREGNIKIIPGYDGEYGIPQLSDEVQMDTSHHAAPSQKGLKDFL
jgi:PHP family Zn ribbon phosphoesterase